MDHMVFVLLIYFHSAQRPQGPFMLSQIVRFYIFYGQIIFHCMHKAHIYGMFSFIHLIHSGYCRLSEYPKDSNAVPGHYSIFFLCQYFHFLQIKHLKWNKWVTWNSFLFCSSLPQVAVPQLTKRCKAQISTHFACLSDMLSDRWGDDACDSNRISLNVNDPESLFIKCLLSARFF